MIKQGEISKIASALKLRDTQIEKDYVIGWVLKGISQNDYLKEKLILKGGTAIRKMYIKDYRLSEDLDFTLNGDLPDSKILKNKFENLAKWVDDNSKIFLETEDEKVNKLGNYSFSMKYKGPLGGIKNSIKVDISDNEIIYNEPVLKEVIDVYTDSEGCNEILCYTISEIIAEKLRSLMQRTAPRDLYDVWFLLENEGYEIIDYIPDFIEKAKFKELNPKVLGTVLYGKKEIFKKSWEYQLTNQLNNVPKFDEVWRTLQKHIKKLQKAI